MSNAKNILANALICAAAVTASSCTAGAFYKIGDMLQDAETRLAARIKQAPLGDELATTEQDQAGIAGGSTIDSVATGPDGLTVPVNAGQENADVSLEDVDLAEFMAYLIMLNEQYGEGIGNGLPQGMPVNPNAHYGPAPGYGQPVYGQVGYQQQAWPQGYANPQAQSNAGWTMPSDGSLPMVNYDSQAYSNPESAYYDQYEVDSEGWSGGAYENPASASYDASYDTGSFDSGSFSSFDSDY